MAKEGKSITGNLNLHPSFISDNHLPEFFLLSKIVERAYLDLVLDREIIENRNIIQQAIRWFENDEPDARISYRFCADVIPLSAYTMHVIAEMVVKVKYA